MTVSNEPNRGEAQRLERVYEQLTTLLNQPAVAQRLRTAPGENE